MYIQKKFAVIPAMDLMDGQCVRLTGGDFSKRTNYSSDPLEVARLFEEAGFQRLHMVDLDGARSGSPKHIGVLAKVAEHTGLRIDYSGGIKTDKDIETVFNNGAGIAAIGSIAVKNKALFLNWLKEYGNEKILLGVDVRDGKLALSGWLEQTEIDVFDFLKEMTEHGILQVFCTDIGRDGMMTGPSVALYQQIIHQFPGIRFIASGGVSTPGQLVQLHSIGCAGAIVGKAIYEDLDGLQNWVTLNP